MTSNPGQGESEINLSLSWWMLQGNKDFLVLLNKSSYSCADSGISPTISMFIANPLPYPFGCVTLLARHLEVIFKNLKYVLFKRTDLGAFSRFALLIPWRFAVGENLIEGAPMHPCFSQ